MKVEFQRKIFPRAKQKLTKTSQTEDREKNKGEFRRSKISSTKNELVLTASDVPRIPPEKVHVPHKPNIVVFCEGRYHPDNALMQFPHNKAYKKEQRQNCLP